MKKEFSYYMFDWDDTILYMSTIIHIEKKINDNWVKFDVSTTEFRDIRKKIVLYYETGIGEYRYPNDDANLAYIEFRDVGERKNVAFLLDAMDSIMRKRFAPSWKDFIECLTNASLFMIITARGHEPNSIKLAIEYIIYNVLTQKQYKKFILNIKKFNDFFNKTNIEDERILIYDYLNSCEFIGINSNYFKTKFNVNGEALNPEKFKSYAIEYFVDKVSKYQKNKKIKVGFSDDDTDTLKYVHNFIQTKLLLKYKIDYFIYNTKNGKVKIKNDIKYE